ncbi:MAG TPA: transcription elongation factor Spt5 [Candidatus Norongarragalinales archaeon]|nr:transcription elongation factor Spt5 [Candidatus Norongarragalinales archaeon]
MLFAYRVTAGQESIVADLLSEKVRKSGAPIQAIIVSPRLKGYLMVEGSDQAEVKKLVAGVPHVKGVLAKSIEIGEIKELLESAPVEINLERGQLVEITSGPFKGEKAKIVRIDHAKEDVTVELVEVAVPIPVTIKLDTIKVLTQGQRG